MADWEFSILKDLNQKLIVALVIVPLFVGIFLGAAEMSIAAFSIIAALFFSNLDKFSRFKGGGIEAELRIAVDQAYAAIDQLKELGLSLSGPIVDELALSGRIGQYIHLKYKLKNVADIAETLEKLGASEKEIEEVCSTIYHRVTDDHMRHILHSLLKLNPEKGSLFEGVSDMNPQWFDWNKNKLETFIKDNDLKKNEETEELIRDLDYFLKNRKLRREEHWQS